MLFTSVFFCECRERASQQLTIFAASSLTDILRELKKNFEDLNESIDINIAHAGSQVLRLQIEQGAEADIFLSANRVHIQELVSERLAKNTFIFAHNKLSVIVPQENSSNISNFKELIKAKQIVVGTPNVPIGRYTREMLDKVRQKYGAIFQQTIFKKIVSEESNVRLIRAKIELNEADAGIVYKTDAIASKKLKIISVPAEINVFTSYYAGEITQSMNTELIEKWIDFLKSKQTKITLEKYGFEMK